MYNEGTFAIKNEKKKQNKNGAGTVMSSEKNVH